MALSPKLSALLGGGATQLTRPEVTSALWAYIKSNKLQDATVRTTINLDAALEDVRLSLSLSLGAFARARPTRGRRRAAHWRVS